MCLLHSQLEGIITDYLIFKNILKKEVNNNKTSFININQLNHKKTKVSGLSKKIDLAKDINENFKRLENFNFDENIDLKFHHERNDILHGSNLNNFTMERCFVVFIWLDSILSSIHLSENKNSSIKN